MRRDAQLHEEDFLGNTEPRLVGQPQRTAAPPSKRLTIVLRYSSSVSTSRNAPSSSIAMSPAAEACARTIGFAPVDGSAARSAANTVRSISSGWPWRVAGRRPHDRRARPAIAIDDGADGRRRHAAGRRPASRSTADTPGRSIDVEAGDQRRQLAAVVVAVHHEARRQPALGETAGDGIGVVPDHHDHVVDAGVEKGADDARQERVVVAERAGWPWRVPCATIGRPRARARESRTQCYRIATMSDVDIHIRCQRCGAEMEMRDPGTGTAVDARSILGLQRLRTSFLDDVPAAARRPSRKPRRRSPLVQPNQRISHECLDDVLEIPTTTPMTRTTTTSTTRDDETTGR